MIEINIIEIVGWWFSFGILTLLILMLLRWLVNKSNMKGIELITTSTLIILIWPYAILVTVKYLLNEHNHQ